MKTIVAAVAVSTIVGAIASVLCAWASIRSMRRSKRVMVTPSHRHAFERRRDHYRRKLARRRFLLEEARYERRLQQRRARDLLNSSLCNSSRARFDLLTCALTLMATRDIWRYAREWAAHLFQLIEEGELSQARRDRRRLALAAITLAVALRMRRALNRARTGPPSAGALKASASPRVLSPDGPPAPVASGARSGHSPQVAPTRPQGRPKKD